jgi:hypothetical protein
MEGPLFIKMVISPHRTWVWRITKDKFLWNLKEIVIERCEGFTLDTPTSVNVNEENQASMPHESRNNIIRICPHHKFIIRRRPKKYVYWTRCFKSTERCLYRENRWTGAFDQWGNDQWVDAREAYWRVVADDGYVTSRRRAKTIRKAFTLGHTVTCRHAPNECV